MELVCAYGPCLCPICMTGYLLAQYALWANVRGRCHQRLNQQWYLSCFSATDNWSWRVVSGPFEVSGRPWVLRCLWGRLRQAE